jgi:hypothetical protein
MFLSGCLPDRYRLAPAIEGYVLAPSGLSPAVGVTVGPNADCRVPTHLAAIGIDGEFSLPPFLVRRWHNVFGGRPKVVERWALCVAPESLSPAWMPAYQFTGATLGIVKCRISLPPMVSSVTCVDERGIALPGGHPIPPFTTITRVRDPDA